MVNPRHNGRSNFRNNESFLRFIRGAAPASRVQGERRRGSRRRGQRRANGRTRTVNNSREQPLTPPFSPNFYSQIFSHASPTSSTQLTDTEVKNLEIQLPGYLKYFGHIRPDIDDFMQKVDGVQDYCTRMGIPNDPETWRDYELNESDSLEFSTRSILADETFMRHWQNFDNELYTYPEEVIKLWGVACHKVIHEAVKLSSNSQSSPTIKRVNVSFHTKENSVTLKQVRADRVGKYISSRGTIIGQGQVLPHVSLLTFECLNCEHVVILPQPDGKFQSPKRCTNCEDCDKPKFRVLFEDKRNVIIDTRRLKLQDMKNDNVGSIPRTLNCATFGVLVDYCKVGDVIEFTGIVKMKRESKFSVLFTPYINIISLRVITDSGTSTSGELETFTAADYSKINEIFDSTNPFKLLVASFCKNITGNHLIKAGIILSLLGGNDTSCNDGMEHRSIINVLLIGDPGVGKSELLRGAERVASRSVYVCGAGATTSGLTATLVREDSHYSVEAGALVIANNGICCVDELDKIPLLHNALMETMEMGSVTICKAGMYRTLPAKTSVIAAGNPSSGHWDPSKTFMENTKLNDALLSRFDLIFPIRDTSSNQFDHNLVEAIGRRNKDGTNSTNLLEDAEIQKYILYAKTYVNPKLDADARRVLRNAYISYRKTRYVSNELPITIRTLESLKRLTEARAKADLRETASKQDALDVIEIFECWTEEKARELTMSTGSLGPQAATPTTLNQKVKRFLQEITRNCRNTHKTIYSKDELKGFAINVNIQQHDVVDLIEILNGQGFLLKKSATVYQFIDKV